MTHTTKRVRHARLRPSLGRLTTYFLLQELAAAERTLVEWLDAMETNPACSEDLFQKMERHAAAIGEAQARLGGPVAADVADDGENLIRLPYKG